MLNKPTNQLWLVNHPDLHQKLRFTTICHSVSIFPFCLVCLWVSCFNHFLLWILSSITSVCIYIFMQFQCFVIDFDSSDCFSAPLFAIILIHAHSLTNSFGWWITHSHSGSTDIYFLYYSLIPLLLFLLLYSPAFHMISTYFAYYKWHAYKNIGYLLAKVLNN